MNEALFADREPWAPRLLIAGSRDITEGMRVWARQAVERAKARQWTIIVGDAVGVDAEIAEAAKALTDDSLDLDGMPRLWCQIYGITAAPRHGVLGAGIGYVQAKQWPNKTTTTYGSRDVHIYVQPGRPITSYYARDEYLVDIADAVLCIWNGVSPGTRRVYALADQRGKPCWMMNAKVGQR